MERLPVAAPARPRSHQGNTMDTHTTHSDAALFNELQGMRPYRSGQFLTTFERVLLRWSNRALWVALGGLAIALLLGAVRLVAGPLPPWLKSVVLVVGVLDIIAWYAMLLSDAAATFVQVAIRKVRDHHDRKDFVHDLDHAASIRQYPAASIARADAWLEQEGSGMERRVSILFGKELAMVTLLTTLLTGKANEVAGSVVTFLAPAFHTSANVVLGALVSAFALLLVGAFRVKARVSRFAYLRYLIRLAGMKDDSASANAL